MSINRIYMGKKRGWAIQIRAAFLEVTLRWRGIAELRRVKRAHAKSRGFRAYTLLSPKVRNWPLELEARRRWFDWMDQVDWEDETNKQEASNA